MATADIIKRLKAKGDDGFTYLGAEQRFVGALRNGGINNLEEQYILGVNTYTISYTNEKGESITEKSFCQDPNETETQKAGFYKLITTIEENALIRDFYFEDNSFIASKKSSFEEGVLKLESVGIIEDGSAVINFSSFADISSVNLETKKEELQFIKIGSTGELITADLWIKTTTLSWDENGREITKEVITS